MEDITIAARFRGPPHSGNGGYVGGLLSKLAGDGRAVMMRAPAPLDLPMTCDMSAEPYRLMAGDTLVAEAVAADPAALPMVPSPPTLAEARDAATRAICYHPICFCCSPQLAVGEGLRVSTGQIAGAPAGHVAGIWSVDASFVDEDGVVPEEIIWAAIDCPGSYAWTAHDGNGGGLTGTMQAEVVARPRPGDECIVMAWPIARISERRRAAGVALFSADGQLMARGYQVWISLNRPPPAP